MADFRNLEEIRFTPAPAALTVVTGSNGAGKTSLLEAVGYLSTGQSLRGSPREALVRTGCERAIVRAMVIEGGRESLIEIEIAPPRRDTVMVNRQRVSRTRDLTEALRVTVFSPDDLALVKGGPQERRAYLDEVLTMALPRLGALRQTLDRVLRQRSTLLRQAGGRATPEVLATLDVWDHQLAVAGSELVAHRRTFIDELLPHAASAFTRLTGLTGVLSLTYVPSYSGELAEALRATRADDLRRSATTVGPHHDDVLIALDALDARTRLSQGRQRAVTLALRLAAHEVVTAHAGSRPVLLLDDAFSELDVPTTEALLSELPEGQAILTTAGHLPNGVQPSVVERLVGGVLVR